MTKTAQARLQSKAYQERIQMITKTKQEVTNINFENCSTVTKLK